jgi:hypothetical protein
MLLSLSPRKNIISEWIHLSRNPKPLQAPRDVHDVGDHVIHDFVDPCTPKHNVSYGVGNDGDMFASQGRNKLYHAMDRMQTITTYMSTIYEDQRQCLEDAWHFGSLWTSDPETKDVHPSIQSAPDAVKLVPHLSPLQGETTSIPISKIFSNFYSD